MTFAGQELSVVKIQLSGREQGKVEKKPACKPFILPLTFTLTTVSKASRGSSVMYFNLCKRIDCRVCVCVSMRSQILPAPAVRFFFFFLHVWKVFGGNKDVSTV